MLQEGSTIVTHLLHPGDRAVGNGNANTMIISSLWNASRNVEHVIVPVAVTHLKCSEMGNVEVTSLSSFMNIFLRMSSQNTRQF